jgi:hypothetical protein
MNGAIKLIQKAANSLSSSAKFTNRIEGGNLNKLVKFLKSDNAVVAMGNSSGGSEPGSAQGEAHHPVGITINFAGAKTAIQNSAYKSNTSVEMAAVVAHEGQHAMDIFNGDGPSNVYESFHMSELHAFMTQSSVDKGLNSNSAWGLWNPSWPASSAENERYNMADQWAQYDAYADCARSGCQ